MQHPSLPPARSHPTVPQEPLYPSQRPPTHPFVMKPPPNPLPRCTTSKQYKTPPPPPPRPPTLSVMKRTHSPVRPVRHTTSRYAPQNNIKKPLATFPRPRLLGHKLQPAQGVSGLLSTCVLIGAGPAIAVREKVSVRLVFGKRVREP
ncbi:uncharacterized protein LY89DRAFT_484355 [Mollisia scopiformis]|uniref:Uncharacterized protein n=1 Tax=Mollisia scopiformis TaxID=149040 RepID=A0A194XHG7_MOLSC|nr:uncharacterized protein LY89DRAFT_484355 [Mollisia scopiformis]KUJ19212.1 hypothetical protein LY89DRAFT_484355 [Mollisia scopiformis]